MFTSVISGLPKAVVLALSSRALQRKGGELVGIVAGDKLSEGLQDKLVDIAINLTETASMLQIGSHTFETVHGEFLQRADILVAFGKDAHGLGFFVVLFASAVPFQNIEFRQFDALLVDHAIFEHIADFQALVNAGVDAPHIEVSGCSCGSRNSRDRNHVDGDWR